MLNFDENKMKKGVFNREFLVTDDNFAIVSEQEGWIADDVYRVEIGQECWVLDLPCEDYEGKLQYFCYIPSVGYATVVLSSFIDLV
tara:strand:- start:8944 stop:9201 length:258 start_codon:yes stop_codon:yes gene_type:complete